VRVIDDALDIDHYSRIVEVEKDIITGINSKVVLGQPIADLNSSMGNLSKSVKVVDNKISAVIDEHGNLVASKIKGTLSDAIDVVTNSTAFITFDNLIGIIIPAHGIRKYLGDEIVVRRSADSECPGWSRKMDMENGNNRGEYKRKCNYNWHTNCNKY